MTPEDARKLLGGYATGSFTEAERKALFEAALEDQELFDELAGEQALKEVLDEPGARQRLITALEPPRKHRVWLWVTAAGTLAIAIVIGIVVSQRTPPPPQQLAQVLKSPEPVAPAPAAEPAPGPLKRKVAPAAPPVTLSAPASELQKAETENKLADRIQEAQSAAAPQESGAIRQFAAARAPSVFAFSYTVSADGFLEIVPAAPGFLSVTANDAIILPSRAVNAATPIRIPIPSAATNLVIAFSRTQGTTGTPERRDETSGTVTDQDPPNGRILIQLFLIPGTR
ncbi:MAG: hypothetical protein LAO55_13395 [Acidobacteriia bacterium]|nr:hypothetical protein [Terriglobia bacterium]